MAKKSNTANVAVPKKKKTFVDICKENIGFFFILPWLFGFLVFKLWPMGSSLFYSFTDYNLFKGMNVIGTLQNYVNVFTTKKITTALTVTFKYAFITVPLKLIFALFIAYILNFKIKGVNFFRTAYYVPSILGGSVAIAVLWKAVFRDDGLLNGFLGLLGITGPSWLSDTKYSLFVICLLRVWQFGSAMIIFLAALKGVPQDLYEAAKIDGCNAVQTLVKVIVPMLSPAITSIALFQFMWSSNDFMGPLLYVNTPAKYPLAIFVKMSMDADSGFQWNRILALSLISIIPSLVVFFMAQDKFVDGISAGGVKG